MLNKKTVDDLTGLQGKKVLVRCDFNVPLKDGVIQNYNRIDGAIPTIKKLLDQGAKVILCSHLGKPKGEPLPEMSLAPVAPAQKAMRKNWLISATAFSLTMHSVPLTEPTAPT